MAQPCCCKQKSSSDLYFGTVSRKQILAQTVGQHQSTSMELTDSRSESSSERNKYPPKLMKFLISLGSEYSFFLFYVIETIKMAPMEGDDSSEKLISSLFIIFLKAAS